MSGTDFDFVSEWLSKADHKSGCTSIIAGTEAICSCGLKDARNAHADSSLIPDCSGDCEYGDQLGKIRSGLEEMIDSKEWPTLTRQVVKDKIKELCR